MPVHRIEKSAQVIGDLHYFKPTDTRTINPCPYCPLAFFSVCFDNRRDVAYLDLDPKPTIKKISLKINDLEKHSCLVTAPSMVNGYFFGISCTANRFYFELKPRKFATHFTHSSLSAINSVTDFTCLAAIQYARPFSKNV